MREWLDSYGKLPSSYDWSRTHAKSRGNVAIERLGDGERPAASVVSQLFGTWKEAREAVAGEAGTSTAAAKFWGMPGIPSGRPDGTLYATATARSRTVVGSAQKPAASRKRVPSLMDRGYLRPPASGEREGVFRSAPDGHGRSLPRPGLSSRRPPAAASPPARGGATVAASPAFRPAKGSGMRAGGSRRAAGRPRSRTARQPWRRARSRRSTPASRRTRARGW